MEGLIFVLVCLSCWRMCHFIVNELGPGDFMLKLRTSKNIPQFFRDWMNCVKCNSVWLGGAFAVSMYFHDQFFIHWLAISAAVIFLETIYALLWWKT